MIKFITKQSILLSSLLLVSTASIAQWTPLNVTNKSYIEIHDVASHKGALYASSGPQGLMKSTDNGTTWAEVQYTGIPSARSISIILDAGTDLYVITWYPVNQSSMVYKSSDEGNTFVTDTVGIPKREANNECINIDRAYIDNGYLVIDVSNMGNYIKEPGKNWVKSTDTKVLYAELFGFYDGTTYAWNEYSFAVSEDYGKTWTNPTMTGVPGFFMVNMLNVNEETGRVYVAGTALITQEYRLMYTDDEGATWDSIAIHQYLGKNWLSQKQKIVAMYSNDDLIVIGLDNDAATPAAEVLTSTDGGVTFTEDTDGLHTDGGGTTQAKTFTLYNGYLFMALNFKDIYRKGISVGIDKTTLVNNKLTVYPNPATNVINLSFDQPFSGDVKLYNMYGQELSGYKMVNNSIDITSLPAGMYLLKVLENNTVTGTKLLIKQ